MMYFLTDATSPVHFVSGGQLNNADGFIHPRRNLDTFVLIFVIQGELYIAQDQTEYVVRQNEFIILFANHDHWGIKPSTTPLSYYWVHFSPAGDYEVTHEDLSTESRRMNWCARDPVRTFILPEKGKLDAANRVMLSMSELHDSIKRFPRHSPILNYNLSAVLLQVSYLHSAQFNTKDYPPYIAMVIDWVYGHYHEPLSVADLAERYHYNPDYLSISFKRHVGQSLIDFINDVRIETAKTLLLNSNLSTRMIAAQCGYTDEKYFFRVFKKKAGVTPKEYRIAFANKHQNQ